MRRGQQYTDPWDEQSPPAGPYVSSYRGFAGFSHPDVSGDSRRSNTYSNEVPPANNSPHNSASSSGSLFTARQSPMPTQPVRPGMAPSPSPSPNFLSVASLPPIPSPGTSVAQNSAEAALLHDLQHQISLKTIALQTLQHEYDSLLQELERHRTQKAASEKNLEVSDQEIYSLAEERERLQAQVTALEDQVEELQDSRAETRRQLVANGAQYMQIVEMANRLETQSADDKKRWATEKAELQQRVKILEEAMVTGSESQHSERIPLPQNALVRTPMSTASSSTETINVLRAEIGRLRTRTQNLETALYTVQGESRLIQEAAKKLMHSGDNIEQATQGTLG